MPVTSDKHLRFVRLPEVLKRTGLSRSGLYERMSRGEFPRQIPLGARSIGWCEHEIDQWILDRINHARGGECPLEER